MAGQAETPILWLQLHCPSQITSGALSAGTPLPPEAPALVYDKSQGLFSTADDVLGEVVEDIKNQVQFHHDDDWTTFPEIAEFLQQHGVESSYAIAVCPSFGSWAIGVADGWKNRERAAKVALSVALTGNAAPGMAHGGGKHGGKAGGGKAGGGKGARKGGGGALGQQHHQPAPPAQGGGPIMWISVPHSSLAMSGLMPDAPVVSHDKSMGDILSAASYILSDLVPNCENEVEIIHDPDWKTFPEIADAIAQQGGEESCLCVASCPSQGKWGVGAAGSWKHQESTSKLALCIALVAGTDTIHAIQQSHPELAQACAMAGILPSGGGGGRRGGGRAAGQQYAPAPMQHKRAWNGGDAISPGPAMMPARGMGAIAEGHGAPVAWISVPAGSQLPQQGLIPDSVAIAFEKGVDVFSSAHHILSELVPELSEEVSFVHDADCDKYPEITAAVKAGGMEGIGQAVALCPSISMWAVGLAYGWKDRERAAKLALSVRIASGTDNMEALAANYPDYAAFVNKTGLVEGAGAAPQMWAPQAEMHGGGGNKRRRFQEQATPAANKGGGKGLPPAAKGLSPLPRDDPVWVQVEPSAPVHEALENMPLEALAVSTQGGCRPLYACVDKVLVKLLETPDTEVQYIDDPDGSVFGSVAEALQQITDEQCQITVAICNTYGTWAIGVGNKWKDRQNAAKVALATLLSVRSCEVGLAPDLSEFPPICDFVERVKPFESA